MCILGFRTHKPEVEGAWELIKKTAMELEKIS
jgi:hypothetical protein